MSAEVKKNELEVLFPSLDPVTVQTPDGPVEVVVSPINMGQIAEVVRITTPFMAVLKENKNAIKDEKGLREVAGRLLLSNPEEVLSLLAVCLNQPLPFVKKLSPDVGLDLMVKVLWVNLDFFTQRLLPSLLGAVRSLPAFINRLGVTKSS